jgi:6,7-dimethyl-8-ribityllumazine synthase
MSCLRPDQWAILPADPPPVEIQASVGALELPFPLHADMIPHQRQNGLDALAALGAAATGGVDLARPLAARLHHDLLELAIGQRVAETNVQGDVPIFILSAI